MNRRVLFWTLTAVTVVTLWAVSYRWFESEPNATSDSNDRARRMWSEADKSEGDKSAERQHELKALATSLKQNPDHAPILVRMAQLSREQGNTSEAVRHLKEAVQSDPKNREARLELGRALFDSGDVEGALRETQRLLDLDPSDIDGLYNMGAIYGNLGKDERAREYWKKAVAAGPDSESGRRARDGLKQIGG